MDVTAVDLYRHYALPRPRGAAGELRCWAIRTPERVSPRRRKPAVLIIPGGGYEHVSPRESEPVALRFAARGYAPFILNYSVSPLAFPVSLREAALAIRYIREEGAPFEADPTQVAVVGFSAGGHLAGLLGTLWDAPEVRELGEPSLLRPDALGLCYPVAVSHGPTHEGSFENLTAGDRALRDRLSLEKLVRPDMPPAFLWHTRDDGSVPCRNSLLLASAMEEQGVDFALHIYRHGRHGLSTADETVYPACDVPSFSSGIPGWPEEMMNFFREIGFAVRDK